MSVIAYCGPGKLPIKFTTWKFPGGEIGVKLDDPVGYNSLFRCYVQITGVPSSDDIFVALNVCDALVGTGTKRDKISLVMEYLPYSRQDRRCNYGESFALKVFVNMLASQNSFSEIITSDLHSNVAHELIEKLEGVKLVHTHQAFCLWNTIPASFIPDYIIAPDAGAKEKAQYAYPNVLHIYLTKKRIDGKVVYEDYEITGLHEFDNCLVVDDICDGGATFISLAQMLIKNNPDINLYLYVTHGIFSKGTSELLKYYKGIYTYNDMNNLLGESK